jgi:hypothetical protein
MWKFSLSSKCAREHRFLFLFLFYFILFFFFTDETNCYVYFASNYDSPFCEQDWRNVNILVVSNLFLFLLLTFSWNILIWISVIILDLRFLWPYQDRQAYICTKLHGVTSQNTIILLDYILISLNILTCVTVGMTKNLSIPDLILESVKSSTIGLNGEDYCCVSFFHMLLLSSLKPFATTKPV